MSAATTPNRGRIVSWAVLLVGLAAGGCGSRTDPPATPPPLRIAAAADLRRALPELLRVYGDRDGVVAPPVFGASGDLARQIRAGAPFDVFLSADLDFPKTLSAEGLVDRDSIAEYARGALVLLVHPSVAGKVDSLSDLTKAEIRKIAVADDRVAPYGKAARQALRNSGLLEALESRLVPSGPVSQALLHVEEGNADAALVSRSLIAGVKSKVVEVDPSLYDPRIQGLGIVSSSALKPRARRFAAFLLGDEGRRILEANGLGAPQP